MTLLLGHASEIKWNQNYFECLRQHDSTLFIFSYPIVKFLPSGASHSSLQLKTNKIITT